MVASKTRRRLKARHDDVVLNQLSIPVHLMAGKKGERVLAIVKTEVRF